MSDSRSLLRVAGALALAGAAWAAPAPAQEPAPAPSGPPPRLFGETVEVRVINLEVVVTDRDGLVVTGLGAEDFRLVVDGKEVPVRYFSEVRGGLAVEGETTTTVAGIPDLAPGSPVGTNYLVFVDDFFSIRRDRDRVLRDLAQDLGRLGPEDRMALVAFDGSGLEMLTSWTGSQPELERAFQKATDRPALGLQRLSERRSYLGGPGARPPGALGRGSAVDSRLEVSERFYAQLLEQQLDNVVSAAAATLRGFGGPPGRKVAILLSGGWPWDIAEYVTREFGRVFHEPRLERGDRLFAPLVDAANQLGYTLYAVDVPGLDGESANDAEIAAPPDETTASGSFVRENNAHYALQYVARETGGRALVNAGRAEALERAAADTRSYYWLGFVPDWQGDDSRHRTEVEVRRPGLRVRSRAGYLDFSRQREVSMAVESVLMFGAGPNVRDLRLEIGAPRKTGMSTMQVTVRLAVPTDTLTLLPVGDRKVAELELRVAAIDDQGGRSDIPVLPVRLEVPGEPRPGQLAVYQTTLELRRTRNRVVVALYDPAAGAIWSATADVRP
jgi:VWFA-related protein